MKKKYVFFAFKGEMMCFLHVLINAHDLYQKGYECKIVFEGEAVTLISKLETGQIPIYNKCKQAGLIDCICEACSKKLGVFEENKKYDIPFRGDASGHPSMESYLKDGYEIIVL